MTRRGQAPQLCSFNLTMISQMTVEMAAVKPLSCRPPVFLWIIVISIAINITISTDWVIEWLSDRWFLFWTLGQSDWSEIDQDFYSDDEELSIYFGDEAKIENCARTAKSQASNDAASLSDQPGTLMIQKSKLQHSETAVE